jgi:hypothetical protein
LPCSSCFALPFIASTCLALPCIYAYWSCHDLPCICALPCLALPCLALNCLATPRRASPLPLALPCLAATCIALPFLALSRRLGYASCLSALPMSLAYAPRDCT